TFSNNVIVDGQELKKGTYAIYTIPNETSWDVIFYNDASNWGAPKEWDESKVSAKTTVDTHTIPFDVESFTIDINNISNSGASLDLIWGKTYVSVPFEVPTDEVVSKSIEKVMAGPSTGDYFKAATYYHTEGKDLKQALAWMQKATEGDNPPYWYLRRMSLIQADLGDKAGAIATAKKSLAGAEKENNADYIKMNKESIAKWQN
ncbi:hypothetical protein MNBD_BACTEROID04-342, partial [hydrothermal vent metagenome]